MPKKLASVLARTMAQIAAETEPPKSEPDTESVLPDTAPSEPASGEASGDDIKNFDKKQIEIALSNVEELKEVTNASGDLFMTVNGVRGYKVALEYANAQPENQMITPETLGKPKKKKNMESVCVFVWSKPNARVIEFLVSTAQSNNFKKILGFTDHAVTVSEYRM